jgi:YHS domain-containing protein
MKLNRVSALLVLVLVATTAFSQTAVAPLTKVEPKKVCMINEQFMNRDQIPVEVDGKTYFGCCEMCKKRLADDASKRVAIDPVSGKQVDKANAVIGAGTDGTVAYFENEKNLKAFNKKASTRK